MTQGKLKEALNLSKEIEKYEIILKQYEEKGRLPLYVFEEMIETDNDFKTIVYNYINNALREKFARLKKEFEEL